MLTLHQIQLPIAIQILYPQSKVYIYYSEVLYKPAAKTKILRQLNLTIGNLNLKEQYLVT